MWIPRCSPKAPGALDRAEKIENYYGFAEPVSGAELERRSIENAKRLGVRFVTAEAVGLTYTDKLTVETVDKNYPADAVILATGASRAVPRIPGLAGLEGHGVSYCAACDAFFYRGKDVAVLGSGEYALHEVQALLPVAKSVALLTNGAPLTADFPPEVTVHPQAVEAVWAKPLSPACSCPAVCSCLSAVYLWHWAWRAAPHWLGRSAQRWTGTASWWTKKMQTTVPACMRRALHRRFCRWQKARV